MEKPDLRFFTGPGELPFVGREPQLDALADALARARAGHPTVVLLQGEAGIGKSRLLRQAIAEVTLSDAVVLRATGDEAEAALHLGVISQLLAGVAPLPPALAGLSRDPGELNPLAAGVELLDLLGDLQKGLVVVAVDDAHWADSASLHALAFCLRRLGTDRVLAVFAARREELDRLPRGLTELAQEPSGTTIALAGLQPAELAQLARALGAGALSPRAAERLARHTGGSPLLAGALLQELGSALLSTPEGLEGHAPRSYSSVVFARLASCAPSGRELATAGSVLGLRWPLALGAELAGVDDPLAAADEAVEAGLIALEHAPGGMPLAAFRHALVRAALYQELTLTKRAALHRAAAKLVEDPRDALRHRVEAEIGPDPELAAELVATAQQDAAAGSWGTAARAYLWASRVVAGRDQRESHFLDAVVCLLLAGDVAEARTLLEQTVSFAETAALHLARGYLAWTDGAFGRAEQELCAAWKLAADTDAGQLAARAGDLLSSLCVYLGRGAEGIHWAKRALEAHPEPIPGTNRRTSLLVGYGMSGRAHEGLAEAARLQLDRVDARKADGLVGRGTLRLWGDDPVGAREDLLPVVELGLRRGPLDAAMFAAVHLADAEWRLGRWEEALVHAEAGVHAAAEALHSWFIAEAHAVAALPLITRGEWEEAELHVRGAVDAARRVGYGHGSLWAIVARARLAEARGDPERIVRALLPLLQFTGADGVDHPGLYPWREMLGAALIWLGRAEEAGEHAAALERQAEALSLGSARGRALRLRGLIAAAAAQYDNAIPLLESALAAFSSLPQPFDRALIEADLGACLRRAGQRRAAAERLSQARGTLERLHANPYLGRVEQELAACGLRPVRDPNEARERLTAAELAVARLVAYGKSNREVANELVLSPKTVEHHLGRIYQKLGISSRTQLAVRFSER